MAKPDNELTWRDLEVGAIVTTPGNADHYRTGDWRSMKPHYDFTRCIKCGLCAIFCPETCITRNEEGYFEADMYYCKGCGICSRECPVFVINMVEEVD